MTGSRSTFPAKRDRIAFCVNNYETNEKALTDLPFQFRLLSDCLLGYIWPKWVRSGEIAEFRVHAVEQSNSSIIYGDQVFLKLYRRIESGMNPDAEICGGGFMDNSGKVHINWC